MSDIQPYITGAGICCLDYIVTSPQVPWGDTASVSDFQVQGGGLVATALAACARLGAKCDIFSLLGDDQIGDQIVDGLEMENIQTADIYRIPGGLSPFSFIHVDDKTGERTIFHRSSIGLNTSTDSMNLSSVATSKALLIDDIYIDLALAAAKVARSSGIPVVADLVPEENNRELLKYVDVLIAPSHFARQLGLDSNLDAALDTIHQLGPSTGVITLGSRGCVYSSNTKSGACKAFEVDAIDSTGAGDSFHGAYAYGLARGWDIAHCCELASAVAAIKCTKPGGRTGLPSLSQVISFLKDRSSLEWE